MDRSLPLLLALCAGCAAPQRPSRDSPETYEACLLDGAAARDFGRCNATAWADVAVPKSLNLDTASELLVTFQRPLVTGRLATVRCPVRLEETVVRSAPGVAVLCGPNTQITAVFKPEGVMGTILNEWAIQAYVDERLSGDLFDPRWAWSDPRWLGFESFVAFKAGAREVVQSVSVVRTSATQPWRLRLSERFSAAPQVQDDGAFRRCFEDTTSVRKKECEVYATSTLEVPRQIRPAGDQVTLTLERPLVSTTTSFTCPSAEEIQVGPGVAVACAPGPAFKLFFVPDPGMRAAWEWELVVRHDLDTGEVARLSGLRSFVELRWGASAYIIESTLVRIGLLGELRFEHGRMFDISQTLVSP